MVLDFLFPNRCLECSSVISAEEIICKNCEEKVNYFHLNEFPENPLSSKIKLLFPFEKSFALLTFDKLGLSRKILHALKYSNREKTGKFLANLALEKTDKSFFSGIDAMITVPLHPKKLRKRGYNQLHLFANILSEKLKIPVMHNVLERKIYKKAQALTDKKHRAETDNIFRLKNPLPAKHYLLIDDVLTTGNTISSVAWEILKNPGTEVSVLVMAVDL